MKSLKLLFDIIAITILLIMPCTKSYSQVYELTSIEKLNTGDEIIIVNENSKVAMENVAISVNPKAISIESMLNEDKTEINVTSNTNIQWIITKFDNATYSFNTPGTENFLRAINDFKGVSVGTKDSKTEDTYSWDNTNSVLKATKANGITDRYITYSGEKNNDWRAYTSIVNLNPKTIFFKRTKNIANIKFETDNFTIKAGDNFNAPNLIYTEGLTGITYSMECTPMYSSDVPENMAIDSPLITKRIESAQKKVETFHFDMRKSVLEYDDVMNIQREKFYRQRRRVLAGEGLQDDIYFMMEREVDRLMKSYI